MFSKILSHILCALIGAVGGFSIMALTAYLAPDCGFIIRKSVEEKWSKEEIGTAFRKSLDYWN